MVTTNEILVTAPRYRQASLEGIEKVSRFESLRLLAYDDQQPKRSKFGNVSQVKGVPTIGFGHTKTVTKLDVVNGRRITKAQALDLRRADLHDAYVTIEKQIGRAVVFDLSQCQYDALVSFVYNCGLKSSWTITKLLKQRRFNEVPDQMIRFVYDDGKRLQGLVDRRRVEVDLWREDETHHASALALTGVAPKAQPTKAIFASRTVRASVLAGISAVMTGTTAAIAQLSPNAGDSPLLQTLLVVFVLISTVGSFAAAALRAADQAGAAA